MRIRPGLITILALSAACLAACSSPRPVHVAFDDADVAMERGAYEKAAADYEYILDRRPGSVEAKYSRVPLARCYLELDRPAMAREQLEIARTYFPNDPEILDLLADASIRLGDVSDLHGSLTNIAREKNRPADWIRLGQAMAATGDMDEAERAFMRAVILDRGRGLDSQLALARFYQQVGDDESALRRLRMALYIDPANDEVRNAIRDYGEVPGPTYALKPSEWR